MKRDETIGSARNFTIDVTEYYCYEKESEMSILARHTHAKKTWPAYPRGDGKSGVGLLMHMFTQTFQPVLNINIHLLSLPINILNTNTMPRLLEVKDLKTHFLTDAGLVKAVDGISFYIDECEIVGLVGESGCGKSVSQLSVMQLIRLPGRIAGGEILFNGTDPYIRIQHLS